jgi:hypothetical protein
MVSLILLFAVELVGWYVCILLTRSYVSGRFLRMGCLVYDGKKVTVFSEMDQAGMGSPFYLEMLCNPQYSTVRFPIQQRPDYPSTQG